MLDLSKELNEDTVYIKPVVGFLTGTTYAVCDHKGYAFTSFETRDAAFAAARMHDLIPHSMH